MPRTDCNLNVEGLSDRKSPVSKAISGEAVDRIATVVLTYMKAVKQLSPAEVKEHRANLNEDLSEEFGDTAQRYLEARLDDVDAFVKARYEARSEGPKRPATRSRAKAGR